MVLSHKIDKLIDEKDIYIGLDVYCSLCETSFLVNGQITVICNGGDSSEPADNKPFHNSSTNNNNNNNKANGKLTNGAAISPPGQLIVLIVRASL